MRWHTVSSEKSRLFAAFDAWYTAVARLSSDEGIGPWNDDNRKPAESRSRIS